MNRLKIDSQFLESWEITGYQVLENFKSKKNEVNLVRFQSERCGVQDAVVKSYQMPAENRMKEVRILRKLKRFGVQTPELFFAGPEMIVMEYIRGEVCADILQEEEKKSNVDFSSRVESLLRELRSWLAMFYRATRKHGVQILVGDVNLRNFIFNEEGIWGVDFESCRPGRPEEDVGGLCAYVLSYDPPFTAWKLKLAGRLFCTFARHLDLKPDRIRTEMSSQLRTIEKRRGADFSVFQLSDILPICIN